MFFFFSGHAPRLPQNVAVFFARQGPTWDETEALLGYFRRRRPDLTVGGLHTFLYIARRSALNNDGVGEAATIKEISQALNLSYSTAARHCDLLAEGYGPREGLGWIEKTEGEDKRSRTVQLSVTGISVLEDFVATQEGKRPK